MANPQEGWAVGEAGTMLHYQQESWHVAPPIVETDLKAIQMFEQPAGTTLGSAGWTLGERVLLRYQNQRWEPIALSESNPVLHAMSMLDLEEGWLMSSNGILHYKGGIWDSSALPLRVSYSAIQMLNSQEGWAVGCCAILHYTNP